MTESEQTDRIEVKHKAALHAAPALRSLEELESQITELAGHLNAASYRWLVLIAEFDRREGWADGSTPSCAHWLGWKCGIDAGAAREKVRVARALVGLPMISAAMALGELSYSKVRALTRVATAATEESLLMIALYGTAHHVETVVRGYRRAKAACELNREAMQHANRGLNWYYDDDGSLVLRARLTAETGAVLVKALELATENGRRPSRPTASADVSAAAPQASQRPDATESPDSANSPGAADAADAPGALDAPDASDAPDAPDVPDVPDLRYPDGPPAFEHLDPSGEPETPSQRRADALGFFAETWLSHGHLSLSGDRHQVVVHVDSETLSNDTPGRCEIEHGPALAVQTAQRLSCDASLVTIVEDESGQALDVGRKMRTIPPAIRRALRSRDPVCRFPGCTHTHHLDGHHIQHWAHGGETKLLNLVMLCRFHHRQVHEGRVGVRMLDDGALRFTGARGQPFEAAPSTAGDATLLIHQNGYEGIEIDAKTAVTRWCGEGIDYHMAVGCLLDQQERADRADRDVAAGTLEPRVNDWVLTRSTEQGAGNSQVKGRID